MLVPKMITLIRMDAAFRCLQHYDPDLDCSPLTADWSKLNAKDRASHYAQTHVLRMMMMARIADIVRQTPDDEIALDAAIAMVEVLISSCEGRGEHPSRGHKQAMQAIQLLGSVHTHLDVAVDLFFDLVERFCAQSRSRGLMQPGASTCSDAFAERMLANYDQALLRLISKHGNPRGACNVTRPMERIKDLRHLYEFLDGSKMTLKSRFRRKTSSASALFPDSYNLLRKARKQGIAAFVLSSGRACSWASSPKLSRSTSSDLSSPTSVTTWSTGSVSTGPGSLHNTAGTCSQIDLTELIMNETGLGSSRVPIEMEIEQKTDLRPLYEITEESEYGSAVDIMGLPTILDFDYQPTGWNSRHRRYEDAYDSP